MLPDIDDDDFRGMLIMNELETLLSVKKLAKITNSKIAYFDGESTMFEVDATLSGINTQGFLGLKRITKSKLVGKNYPKEKGYYGLAEYTCDNTNPKCKINKPDKTCKSFLDSECGRYVPTNINDINLKISAQRLMECLYYVPVERISI